VIIPPFSAFEQFNITRRVNDMADTSIAHSAF